MDIFKIFEIETKEDKYTFCLQHMINEGGNDFRNKIAEYFNLNGDYRCERKSFPVKSIDGKKRSSRKHITPDLILISEQKAVVIESKMFSEEGDLQTLDYEGVMNDEFPEKQKEYYYLTLAGKKAENEEFKPVKWADFYTAVLSDIVFDDECLEMLRKTILNQAEKYLDFNVDRLSKSYNELFADEERYWVTPYSIFVSGDYDDKWSDGGKYVINNLVIQGSGHAEIATDVSHKSWTKYNDKYSFNPYIRIEWGRTNPVVWLCWEYYDIQNNNRYLNPCDIEPKQVADSAVIALKSFKENWNNINHLEIKITDRRERSLKALKGIVDGNMKYEEVIRAIEEYISYYKEEIERILSSSGVEDGLFVFDSDKYAQSFNNVKQP